MDFITNKVNQDLSLLYRDNTRGIKCSSLESYKGTIYELSKILNVDVETLLYKNHWYLYQDEFYYLKKRACISYILNELLGEYISQYMSLPTVTYDLALDDDKIVGLLSKNFLRSDGNYKQASEINFLNMLKLNFTLSNLSFNKELHEILMRIIAKDYFVCMRDRGVNTLCEESFFDVSIAPLYDYEKSFSISSFLDYYYNPLFSSYSDGVRGMRKIDMRFIRRLFKNDPYFREQLEKMLDFDMLRALDNIRDDKKINLPEEVVQYYLYFNNLRKETMIKSLKKVG